MENEDDAENESATLTVSHDCVDDDTTAEERVATGMNYTNPFN